jgi:hypothetical protein
MKFSSIVRPAVTLLWFSLWRRFPAAFLARPAGTSTGFPDFAGMDIFLNLRDLEER